MQSKKSNFIAHFWCTGQIWSVRAVNLVSLDWAATKKGRQVFREKSAPPEKILATPMTLDVSQRSLSDTSLTAVSNTLLCQFPQQTNNKQVQNRQHGIGEMSNCFTHTGAIS